MIQTPSYVTDLNYMQDPIGRSMFFGTYSAKVVDVNDPLKKGRIKVQIPQITGVESSNWADQVTGKIADVRMPYGTFTSSSTQSITTSVAAITGWTQQNSNKITVNGTQLVIPETGTYLVDVRATFTKNSLGQNNVSISLRKNGAAIANATQMVTALGLISGHTVTAYTHTAPSGGGTVTGNHTDMVINHSGAAPIQQISLTYTLELKAKDYLEVGCLGSSSGSALSGNAIATLNLIGKFVPKVGSNVWVTFRGGNPEYPVWIGAEA
jgi:Type VI secretion system/phage-baseplate injector OB domain